ncbi:hypothetical protein BgAZ_202220 [Babesia gibsoni]|uniref:t-SNARE coiled-coil homology domain-containing protein n=1 Tax=Babesia gibsoni TaxID=33632 RepID=A0AAD8LQC6_BABGI|nr:hypothetical protein BgAZ_202220 [Babesia gibsoni]
MSLDGESDWLLDVEPAMLDSRSATTGADCLENERLPSLSRVTTGFGVEDVFDSEIEFPMDGKARMQKYLEEIGKLNSVIDEFSKIIQTLALFKYYIRHRKGNTNVEELHKRFNSFSVKCANKVRIIQQHVVAVNKDNHFALTHRERLNFSYSDLMARFNMQDASVNRLKTLMETYQSVVKEYTATASSIESQSKATVTAGPAALPEEATQANAEATLIEELKSKSKDISTLEKNARDLSILFAELNMTIKKRGENIYNLEQQILHSSEQIEKGKEDMEIALQARGGQGIYWMCIFIALGTCALILPSPIRSAVFKSH